MKTYLKSILYAGLRVVSASAAKAQGVPEVERTQFTPPPEDIRNYRYCEVVMVFRKILGFSVEIYNTMDFNECPADLWNDLDKEAIAAACGAAEVKLNGPRYWVVNGFENGFESAVEPVASKAVNFGGIEMIRRVVIETKFWEEDVHRPFYTEDIVAILDFTVYYKAGDMVYELTSPEGAVYRMQSYAQIVDPTLTINDLETLGGRLDLPEGWSYAARVLEQEEYLITEDGFAPMINDDLGGSYQRVNE